jgi:hypothetical protein
VPALTNAKAKLNGKNQQPDMLRTMNNIEGEKQGSLLMFNDMLYLTWHITRTGLPLRKKLTE